MNNNSITCDPDRIEQFLAQQMNAQDQIAFEQHLDDCQECRQAMEAVAASDEVWDGIRESLPGQQASLAGLASDRDFTLGPETTVDASFSHDSILKLLAPTDDDRMIGRLGVYEVQGVVGSGGMGVVLKALDPALNRYVAIKLLAPHLGSSGAARQRFSREAQAAAAVVHDNVVEIHGVADTQGLPYLVMPYVRGPSLQKRINDDGPLAVVEILRVGMQAAAGLSAAHAQGLVHRDVKPANILLADGIERVKLTDFGLARAADDASLTRTGIIAGTPQYMSPEQARGESVDHRSDLFSLGSVLYAMCTGHSPFRAETSYGVLRRIIDDSHKPIREINPGVPDWLCQVIDKLLSKSPNDRFESAGEVAELLQACLAHLQQPTVVPLPASLTPCQARERSFFESRGMIGTIAILLALFGVAMFGWPQGSMNTPPIEPLAELPMTIPADSSGVDQIVDTGMTGNSSRLACSSDGRLIALANGNPTITMHSSRSSTPSAGWQPKIQIIDANNKKTIALPILASKSESEILAKINPVPWFEVTALAFSPDGKQLAVGTSIGQIKLFDSETGKLVQAFDDQPARLADPKTPAQWKALPRAMGSVTALAFSPNGKQLAVCGTSFADFSEHFAGVNRLGFRASGPGRLKLWDVKTAELQHDLAGHDNHVFAIAFSPNGRRLASAGRWNDEHDRFGQGVILWNPQSGKAVHRLIRTSANGGIRSIAFSPDSKRLVMATQRFGDDGEKSTGGVSVVAVESGIVKWLKTAGPWANHVAFSSDGGDVVVLVGGKSILKLDAETGDTVLELNSSSKDGKSKWDKLVVVSSNSKLVASGINGQRKIFVERLGESDPETK